MEQAMLDSIQLTVIQTTQCANFTLKSQSGPPLLPGLMLKITKSQMRRLKSNSGTTPFTVDLCSTEYEFLMGKAVLDTSKSILLNN